MTSGRAALVEPAGRQGPGPMPGALVEALDLVLARRASGALPGERRAAGRGAGTELAQIRPYQVGDDVRRLDAAASARTGLPHVRDHVPERTLTTWLLVDVSASMAWGTADRLKSDVAEGVALVIGRLAVRRAGRVALLTCGAPVPRLLPPSSGRAALVALQRALSAGVAPDGDGGSDPPSPTRRDGGSDPPSPPARKLRSARVGARRDGGSDPLSLTRGGGGSDALSPLAGGLRRIARLARGHGLVVVVSDFREGDAGPRPGWARALGAVAARHDVLAVEVADPREGELPDAGELVLSDPETGARMSVDTSSAELRRRFAAAELARRDTVAAALRRVRARHVRVGTDENWLRALGRELR